MKNTEVILAAMTGLAAAGGLGMHYMRKRKAPKVRTVKGAPLTATIKASHRIDHDDIHLITGLLTESCPEITREQHSAIWTQLREFACAGHARQQTNLVFPITGTGVSLVFTKRKSTYAPALNERVVVGKGRKWVWVISNK